MLRIIIKLPLLLIENILFSLFPMSRKYVEKILFNPYAFGVSHNQYSKNQLNTLEESLQRTLGHTFTFKNKTVLELGPGGSLGFGLLILEKNAKRYYALESGLHAFISKKQLSLYKELLSPNNTGRYFNREKSGNICYNNNLIRLSSINQDSTYDIATNSIDLVYSCAVLEHVHNLELCFKEMTRVLKPGGIMYHQVDLRDHIFFQKKLLFLKIPTKLYRLFFKECGAYTNRKRFNYYKKLAEKNNLKILDIQTDRLFHTDKKLKRIYNKDDFEVASFNFILQKQ